MNPSCLWHRGPRAGPERVEGGGCSFGGGQTEDERWDDGVGRGQVTSSERESSRRTEAQV